MEPGVPHVTVSNADYAKNHNYTIWLSLVMQILDLELLVLTIVILEY